MTEPALPPSPDAYLPEPTAVVDQDDQLSTMLIGARGFVAPTAPHTFQEALEWLAHQSAHRTEDWTGKCQKCMRMSDGCPGGFASAHDQWVGMDPNFRHVGGDPADAPIGADLFSHSRNPSAASFRLGHIIKKAFPFSDKTIGAWSTDALRTGQVDKINPLHLYEQWDHEYDGWGYKINQRVIDLKDPAPVQDQQYLALGTARVNIDQTIANYRKARETAKVTKDWHDRDIFNDLIAEAQILRTHTTDRLNHLRHS